MYPTAINALFCTTASDDTAFPKPFTVTRLFLHRRNGETARAKQEDVAVAVADDGGVGEEKQRGDDGDARENAADDLDVAGVVVVEHAAAADAGEAGVLGVEADVPERDGEAAVVDEAAVELGGPELDGAVERAGEKVERVAGEVEVGNDVGMAEKKMMNRLRRGRGRRRRRAPEVEEAVLGAAGDLRWKERRDET